MCIIEKNVISWKIMRLAVFFATEESKLSRIFNYMVEFIVTKWRWLLDMPEHVITTDYIQNSKNILNLNFVIFGFIDGTVRQISRPKYNQRIMYGGHKRKHAIKFQAVTLWNGLIGHLSDVYEGKKHDISIFRESAIESCMDVVGARYINEEFFLYGDPAYKLGNHMLSPFTSVNITTEEILFNQQMARYRIIVEWMFGVVVKDWGFIDYAKNMKLYLQPVANQYVVACLLTNFKSCCYGNQAESTYGVPTPTIWEYFNKNN